MIMKGSSFPPSQCSRVKAMRWRRPKMGGWLWGLPPFQSGLGDYRHSDAPPEWLWIDETHQSSWPCYENSLYEWGSVCLPRRSRRRKDEISSPVFGETFFYDGINWFVEGTKVGLLYKRLLHSPPERYTQSIRKWLTGFASLEGWLKCYQGDQDSIATFSLGANGQYSFSLQKATGTKRLRTSFTSVNKRWGKTRSISWGNWMPPIYRP